MRFNVSLIFSFYNSNINKKQIRKQKKKEVIIMKKIIALTAFLLVATTFTACSGGGAAKPNASSSSSVSSLASGQTLSVDEMKKIAVVHAGVPEEQLEFTKIEVEKNADGTDDYIFSMKNSTTNYTYKINSSTGQILNSSAEPINPETAATDAGSAVPTDPNAGTPSTTTPAAPTAGTTGDIGEAKAKEIALNHAGLKEADVTFIKVERDYDNGRLKYEVEFYSGNQEYDYDILASTGEILSFDYDIEHYQAGTAATGTDIGEAKAKEIALAKVPGATNNNIRIKKDYDNGRLIYEGDIIYNTMEYEFEIDASNGTIIEWSSESIYD